jgi:hypothetical protein
VSSLASACFRACLAIAWAHEADYFEMFFAIAAAIAGIEAVRIASALSSELLG